MSVSWRWGEVAVDINNQCSTIDQVVDIERLHKHAMHDHTQSWVHMASTCTVYHAINRAHRHLTVQVLCLLYGTIQLGWVTRHLSLQHLANSFLLLILVLSSCLKMPTPSLGHQFLAINILPACRYVCGWLLSQWSTDYLIWWSPQPMLLIRSVSLPYCARVVHMHCPLCHPPINHYPSEVVVTSTCGLFMPHVYPCITSHGILGYAAT